MKYSFSSSKRSGFTLVELVVVMTIMALLMAITVPHFRGSTHNRQLLNAAKTVQSEFRRSYTLARSEGEDIIFQFSQTSRGLALFRCISDITGACDISQRESLLVGGDIIGEALFVDGDISGEVLFSAPYGDIQYSKTFPEEQRLVLTHKKSGKEKNIIMYDLSGLITVE